MVYNYCSIKEILAKVVRNTRVQDSSFLLDSTEWIPEALAKLRTTYSDKFCYEDLMVRYHRAEMPCNLVTLVGIEYGGYRLPQSNGSRNPVSVASTTSSGGGAATFVSIPTVEEVEDSSGEIRTFYSSTLQELGQLPFSLGEYYMVEPGAILTSFEEGVIRVHFKGLATDCDGLPLIPDNEDLKSAIYFYVRAMMIGAGWPDPVMKFDFCMMEFERLGRRAMNKLTQKTPDQMQTSLMNQVRFQAPAGYYDNFFSNVSGEGAITLD